MGGRSARQNFIEPPKPYSTQDNESYDKLCKVFLCSPIIKVGEETNEKDLFVIYVSWYCGGN